MIRLRIPRSVRNIYVRADEGTKRKARIYTQETGGTGGVQACVKLMKDVCLTLIYI